MAAGISSVSEEVEYLVGCRLEGLFKAGKDIVVTWLVA